MADYSGNESRGVLRSKRVFINRVDSYSSKYIGKFLSTCIVGESLEGQDKEDEDNSSVDKGGSSAPPERAFQIVGTASNGDEEKQSFTVEEYSSDDKNELLQRLTECDVIVYNITEDANELQEAAWAITALHGQIESFIFPKIFILVTPLMTWALTKQEDDAALTEDDFRRRRPLANYKEFSAFEKTVLKLGKTKRSRLSTYVVTSGLIYGMGEGIFHPLFKMAWLGEVDRLPVCIPGTNNVPTIHVNDLAGVIQNIIDHKPREFFFFAVDEGKYALEDIVKAISLHLGPGKIEQVPKEAVLQAKLFTLAELDYLSINLKVDAASAKNTLNVQWTCENGFIENVGLIISEYKIIRELLPIKICILGPPAVGKSTVAQKLCNFYKIHHIDVKAIYERMKSLGADNEQISEYKVSPEDAEHLHRLVKETLNSMPCKNKGYVLDGFPKTFTDALDFFQGSVEDFGPDEAGAVINDLTAAIMPEHIFSLDATDEFLKQRVMALPERVAVRQGYTQQAFLSRLATYRRDNVEDTTVLNYFDELEIHPEHIEINDPVDKNSLAVVEKITAIVGEPKSYGMSSEERQAAKQKAELLQQEKQRKQEEERRRRRAEEAHRMAEQLEKWERDVSEVKRQEEEMLEARSFPLRNYLMKYVMPTVSQGLLQSCKAKAHDPVDYLAEYLLRNTFEDD
ncbi:adenylate kinase 7-like [Engraulis encrasicolus]|uniref:adenylate kinase 7-like n=1 Tax=Engraulis encrasicolus TaxID=184585 RepID=UPI002FCF7015